MTTRYPHADRADLDLQLLAAKDRIAELRADGAPTVHPAPAGPGTTTRARAAVGRRLIALGSALSVDEPTRSERSLA
jgi:hypothetical protein